VPLRSPGRMDGGGIWSSSGPGGFPRGGVDRSVVRGSGALIFLDLFGGEGKRRGFSEETSGAEGRNV
jgi:hypothetical protein